MSRNTLNRIILDNGTGITLVLTEICWKCDCECPTEFCPNCDETFCERCMPSHDCEEYSDDD